MRKREPQNIARLIDHTQLRPDATDADIAVLCNEAVEYGFFSVCVHPSCIRQAKQLLATSKVKICSVIGFPLGANTAAVKQYEALEAVFSGADELDIVINSGLVKTQDWESLTREVSDIVTITPGIIHKVIIETCNLTDNEKEKVALVVMKSGAAFIKTSTGFGAGGAEIRDIELLRSVTKGKIGIKAAGGIKTFDQAEKCIAAGATRIGTSSGVDIMKEIGRRRQ